MLQVPRTPRRIGIGQRPLRPADGLRMAPGHRQEVEIALHDREPLATELGFLSLSQVLDPRVDKAGSHWDVPQDLYDPLKMDAVLLRRAEGNLAALALLDFLKREEARAVIERYGYALAGAEGNSE